MSASRRSRRVDSMIFESDAGATEPSGSSAGVATESAVAKTPGPERDPYFSSGPRRRSTTRSRWLACLRRAWPANV